MSENMSGQDNGDKVDVKEGPESSLEEIMVFEEEGPNSFGEEPSEFKAESNSPSFEDKRGQEPPFEDESGTFKPPFGTEPTFGEIENDADVIGDSHFESAQKKTSKRAELEKRVNNIEDRITTIKSDIKTIEATNNETNGIINKLNGSIQELLSIYEFLTSDINPFLEKNLSSDKSQTSNISNSSEDLMDLAIEVDVSNEQKDEEILEDIRQVEKLSDKNEQIKTHIKGAVRNEDKLKKAEIEKNMAEGLELSIEDLIIRPSFSIILSKWANYLFNKLGSSGMAEALDYYEDIGWINPSIKNGMINFAKTANDRSISKKTHDKIRFENHIVSLFFLSKLQGTRIRPDLCSSILVELAEWEALE